MTDLCDVTIRESEQLPGRSYDLEAKREAGRALDDLGVAFVQVGFPITGKTDRRAVATLADELEADIVAIARTLDRDVDAAIESGADVIEVFAPLSTRHLETTLDTDRETAFDRMRRAVDRAAASGATVHLSIMDAFRTADEHVDRAIDRFEDVAVVTLADTVGAMAPLALEQRLGALVDSGVDPDRLGVHLHDDLGVATANALVAARHDVGRLDVSVASLGERAGNPALEEVAIHCDREGYAELGLETAELVPRCEDVLAALEEPVDERKAVLGRDVFEHESGLHTAAMLRDPSTFEPFDPETYGGERSLVFGAGSGSGAARALLEAAGVEATDARVETILSALEREGPVDLEGALELARDEQ
ncbi:citramalate synthase [Salinadaptatus halalkaliphilus]|uniref:Citramalate synthase n=1 Tax=Salinadaptatus halalkaliphilus TaxID=2419781 RepID=A0A4S3TNU8_9EURY|nr:LeuA family protein [Salinadaptatus halalkaliphilus]THE64903.1 citramalate synthase [Salinadaptatus halalkaliphilus]